MFFPLMPLNVIENDLELQESEGTIQLAPPSNSSAQSSLLSSSPHSSTVSDSLLMFRSNSTGNRRVYASEKPKYEPGRSVTGSAVDPSYLLIHERQRGNPILAYLRQVKWQHTPDIVPDFQFGANQCGVFVSMKYHQSNGAYINNRISTLPGHYVVRILLVLVDLDDHEQVLMSLNNLAVARDMTLILAFSPMEAARYLETYKSFENTNADTLKESAAKGDHFEQLRVALGAIKSINSNDVANLLLTFGSVAKIMTASMEQLATVPRLGDKKILALYHAFHDPFITSAAYVPQSILTPSSSSSSSSSSSTQTNPPSNIFKHRGVNPPDSS